MAVTTMLLHGTMACCGEVTDVGPGCLTHTAWTFIGADAAHSERARRRAKRKVNQRFLSAMADMGIPADKAELALSETGNVGVEVRSVASVHLIAAQICLTYMMRIIESSLMIVLVFTVLSEA